MANEKYLKLFDQTLTEGAISTAAATFMTIRFVSYLSKPFEDWPAFKLELIDKDGKIIKKSSNPGEKAAMNPLMNLIRKIKRIVNKIIPNKAIIPTLVSLYLLTENKITNGFDLKDEIIQELDESELIIFDQIIQELKDGIE